MQVMNCPRCRKLFTKIMSPVCPECAKLEEEQFENLKKFLEENPLSSINETSEATGVSPKRILQYIRDGRIMVPEGMMAEIRCKKCGGTVYSGNYCEPCSKKMASALSGAFTSTSDSGKKGSGMFTGEMNK